MQAFNNTSLNLEILAEEAGEIIEILGRIARIKSKIIRFGLKDHHPKNNLPNHQRLEEEIGHFLAMKDILVAQGTLSQARIQHHARQKLATLGEYYQSTGNARVETLTCSCCGATVTGRQWKHREKGYGICNTCITWLKTTGKDDAQLRHCYGDHGYHYNIKA